MPTIPTTDNLDLWLPPPEVYDGDPNWGSLLNENFETIAQYMPTPDNPLKTGSFLVDADLDFNGYAALDVDYLGLTSHGSTLSTDFLRALYAVGNDLWYNDNDGNPVRIIHNGSVDAGNGNIIGLPSTPAGAAVTYANVSGYTFLGFGGDFFAPLFCGGVNIFDTATGPAANGIGLKSPSSLAAGWDWTLPDALPAADGSFLQLNADGTSQYVAKTSPVILAVDTGYTGSSLSYYRDACGRLFITGGVFRSGASTTTWLSGSNVLPSGYRPTQTVRFLVPDLSSPTAFNVVQFNTDGSAEFLSTATSGHTYALDCVSFRVS